MYGKSNKNVFLNLTFGNIFVVSHYHSQHPTITKTYKRHTANLPVLTRSLYSLNPLEPEIKKQINLNLGKRIFEIWGSSLVLNLSQMPRYF